MARLMTTKEGKRLAKLRWARERAATGESESGARRRLAIARADRAETEAAWLRGELVERARVEKLTFEFARRYRDALLAWPARIAATLAARLGADPHAVEAALVAEVHRHLEELARDPLPRLGGPGAG